MPRRPAPIVVDVLVALALDTARNLALGMVATMATFSVLSAWLIKNLVVKGLLLVVLVALAIAAWSQRSELQSCADQARGLTGGATVTCTFFGTDVTVG